MTVQGLVLLGNTGGPSLLQLPRRRKDFPNGSGLAILCGVKDVQDDESVVLDAVGHDVGVVRQDDLARARNRARLITGFIGKARRFGKQRGAFGCGVNRSADAPLAGYVAGCRRRARLVRRVSAEKRTRTMMGPRSACTLRPNLLA